MRARGVTQLGPCGLEPLQVRAALVSIFPLPHVCNHDVFIPATMANKYILITVVPMFMILVVNAHARVISWAGVCGDRLATVVIRRGATTDGIRARLTVGYPSQLPLSCAQ